jgi:hypothetical protein
MDMSERDEALKAWIDRGEGVAGTLHVVVQEGVEEPELHLVASHNIPPKVADVTRVIPRGKGMAGLAWSRVEPVQTCNLREDQTGDVRPGARAVDAKGAVAIPLLDAEGRVIAVAGIAYADERELSAETVASLAADARSLLV